MPFDIFSCSPQAQSRLKPVENPVKGDTIVHMNAKFPFTLLDYGQSFALMFEAGDEANLRSAMRYHNLKRNGKEFEIVKHVEGKCFELVRVK